MYLGIRAPEGTLALERHYRNPITANVIVEMAPLMLLHMLEPTDLHLQLLGLEEWTHEEDHFSVTRPHLASLQRRLSLRQSILGEKETRLAYLLRGLTLYTDMIYLELRLPLAYHGSIPCLRSRWVKVSFSSFSDRAVIADLAVQCAVHPALRHVRGLEQHDGSMNASHSAARQLSPSLNSRHLFRRHLHCR